MAKSIAWTLYDVLSPQQPPWCRAIPSAPHAGIDFIRIIAMVLTLETDPAFLAFSCCLFYSIGNNGQLFPVNPDGYAGYATSTRNLGLFHG